MRPILMKPAFMAALVAATAFIATATAWATQSGPSRAPVATVQTLDKASAEFIVMAVTDIHRSTCRLAARLDGLEKELVRLRRRNKELEAENSRVRRTLALQNAPVDNDWQSYPLDREVRDANRLLMSIIDKLGTIVTLGRTN